MKKIILLFFVCLSQLAGFGQNEWDKAAADIVAEGKRLYRSEMASWYGTDIFLEKFKEKMPRISGYFSYLDNDSARCIFYSTDSKPKVLGTMSFDSTYDPKNGSAIGTERDFTEQENILYSLRMAALKDVSSDTMYKHYANSNYNLVPIISGNQRKVYILTGPSSSGKVIIGNDYLLTFDNNNKLLTKKKLHQSIMFFDAGTGTKEGEKEVGGMHTHLAQSGDFITPTDICTLMLYGGFARWEQHIVISDKYVSIWNCKTNQLTVLPKKAWEKSIKDAKKSGK